jgi:hypothetical protein
MFWKGQCGNYWLARYIKYIYLFICRVTSLTYVKRFYIRTLRPAVQFQPPISNPQQRLEGKGPKSAKMKLSVLPLAFAVLVSAIPSPRPQSSTATCTSNILVIARGSTEGGNIVSTESTKLLSSSVSWRSRVVVSSSC